MARDKIPEDGWPLDFVAEIIGADPAKFKAHVRGLASPHDVKNDRILTDQSIEWILTSAPSYGCTVEDVRRRWYLAPAREKPLTAATAYVHNGSILERLAAVLPEVRGRVDVLWVTYSFGPFEPAQLDWLRKRVSHIRILCRHPREGSVTILRDSYHAWIKAGLGQDIWGLVSTADEADEGEPPGPLHAKAIAVYTTQPSGESSFRGLVGSFNLARTSLSRNTETAVDVPDGRQLWYELDRLFRSPFARKITLADCLESADWEDGPHPRRSQENHPEQTARLPTGSPHPKVDYKSPPRDTYSPAQTLAYKTQPLPVYQPPSPSFTTPALQVLDRALGTMMQEWPSENAKGRGWQVKVYQRLRTQMHEHGSSADVLYLPVALGKTFIALRWLLDQFMARATSYEQTGVFLAPNEWIVRSVRADVDKILEAALRAGGQVPREEIQHAAASCWRILRPSEFASRASSPVACVADECHNWNPHPGESATEGYSGIVDEIRRRKIPLLGLSATPCRMDHGSFDVGQFLGSFRTVAHPNLAPFLNMQDAIDAGLLAHHKFVPLLQGNGRDEIKDLLQREDAMIAMGDYHMVVLRKVWEILQQRRTVLLDQLGRHFAKARRVLVFLPPVGAASDEFVKRLRKLTDKDAFFDFRDRAEGVGSANAIFESFRSIQPKTGAPAVLVTVNRFAEGVSINDIDTVVMLRATLSPRIATQAIGRGLRLDPANPEKTCTILDPVCIGELMEGWEGNLHDASAWDTPPGEILLGNAPVQPGPAEARTGVPQESIRSLADVGNFWFHYGPWEIEVRKDENRAMLIEQTSARNSRYRYLVDTSLQSQPTSRLRLRKDPDVREPSIPGVLDIELREDHTLHASCDRNVPRAQIRIFVL